jgi:hypothetical protein
MGRKRSRSNFAQKLFPTVPYRALKHTDFKPTTLLDDLEAWTLLTMVLIIVIHPTGYQRYYRLPLSAVPLHRLPAGGRASISRWLFAAEPHGS